MRKLSLVLVVAALLNPPLATTALAAALTISPLRLNLDAAGRPEVVRLTNGSDSGTLIQLEAFAWTDVSDPKALEPSRDLLAVPPVFQLAPGATQTIRVALRRPLELDRERSYRLVISEVPAAISLIPNAISFALEMSLPVFVAPKGAAPKPAWALRTGETGRPELVLANHGNAHVRVAALRLAAPGQPEPVLAVSEAAYVLGGEERRWPLDPKAGALAAPLTVTAETNLGTLEAVVAPAGP